MLLLAPLHWAITMTRTCTRYSSAHEWIGDKEESCHSQDQNSQTTLRCMREPNRGQATHKSVHYMNKWDLKPLSLEVICYIAIAN